MIQNIAVGTKWNEYKKGEFVKMIDKIKKVGIKQSVKLLKDRCFMPLERYIVTHRWEKNKNKEELSGLNKTQRDIPLVISLTTYPARIKTVHLVIESLITQTIKADHIILWLAKEQFPEQESSLPEELLVLKKYGLEIKWCKDIRSYKKLIPTLKIYPDAIIITTDDDVYYHPKMIERLYRAYLKEPQFIHCHRVTKVFMRNNEYDTIAGGYEIYNHPSFLHKLTGCGGVCYPPHSLYKDVLDEKLFNSLAPTNDDVWFWIMGLLNGYRCNVVKHSCTALIYIDGSQKDSLSSINDSGENLFKKQFEAVLNHYPQADTTLRYEWKEEKL